MPIEGGNSCTRNTLSCMLIKKHDKSHIVELEDGSRWRIWPGDISATLQWSQTTDILVAEINEEFCSHVLVDRKRGSWVRVIRAGAEWPIEEVRRSLKNG